LRFEKTRRRNALRICRWPGLSRLRGNSDIRANAVAEWFGSGYTGFI